MQRDSLDRSDLRLNGCPVMWKSADILRVLDGCCAAYSFPMLDNGYVYLAASRLSVFRSVEDWALVIEIFGYSPRSGIPDSHVYTFGSRVVRQKTAADYVNQKAFEAYLTNNPHNESTFIFPIDEGDWQAADSELLARGQHEVLVRGRAIMTPPRSEYATCGIALSSSEDVHAFEFTRWLADSCARSFSPRPKNDVRV